MGEKPFLLTLDDFEWNLQPRAGEYILKETAVPVLAALVLAIQETGTNHRIIITCRYNFDSDLLEYFYKQGLEPFRKSELTKKLNRLEHFKSNKLSKNLRERALILADGNPRLLEFINDEVLCKQDVEAKLTELEQSTELWKEKIIWEELYQLIDKSLQQALSYYLVYEIPVPMLALEAVCERLYNYQQELQRGLKLGLIEMSFEIKEENRVYRVSRILPHIIPNVRLPEAPEIYSLYRKAFEKLYHSWGNRQNNHDEQWQEIFRLLLADKKNINRFRQGFSLMLKFQAVLDFEDLEDSWKLDGALSPNILDAIYESEMRKNKVYLPEDELYSQLEDYLKEENWRDADKETTYIFYKVMILEGYENWNELLEKFPREVFNKIDEMWIKYSNGRFGFSVQKHIVEKSYEEVSSWDWIRWNSNEFNGAFQVHVLKELEWYNGDDFAWNDCFYRDLNFSMNSKEGHLPAMWTTQARMSRGKKTKSSNGYTHYGFGLSVSIDRILDIHAKYFTVNKEPKFF